MQISVALIMIITINTGGGTGGRGEGDTGARTPPLIFELVYSQNYLAVLKLHYSCI